MFGVVATASAAFVPSIATAGIGVVCLIGVVAAAVTDFVPTVEMVVRHYTVPEKFAAAAVAAATYADNRRVLR